MTRALVAQLVEALEYAFTGNRRPEILGAAITAAREYLETEPDLTLTEALAQSAGPYAVFHGSVDSGEHGAFNLDLLKMIPRGAYLYLHQPQPQATTPVTLRDYFAAKAMQAYFAREDEGAWSMQEAAAESYRMADAMLDRAAGRS